jgi:hypothetical protein
MVAVIALLAGCIHFRGDMVALRLDSVSRAMGTPTESPRRLVYSVEGDGGTWTHEVVLGEHLYAERRHRSDGVSYAFGRDEIGTWLRMNEVTVEVDGSWSERVATLSAIHRVRFLEPSQRERVSYLGRDGRYWELSYRPEGGQTMTFFVDRLEHRPKKLDYVDEWARIVSCHHLHWERAPDGATLAASDCGAGNMSRERPDTFRERIRLIALTGLTGMPSWTRPRSRQRAVMIDEPVAIEIDDPHRLHLPVELNGVETRLLLDSGAFHTILSEPAAAAAGVIPTGEAPLFVTPPWLGETELWVGLVHTLRVGHAVVHGARVLVAKSEHALGREAGLLGRSFIERFVVDVDSPAEVVRLWSREAFARCRRGACADLIRIPTSGPLPRIEGEVTEVARGPIVLDTGMVEPMVVLDPMVRWKMRRQRDRSAFLGPQDGAKSPDYYAEVPGAELGPFVFPPFEGVARFRERDRVGPQVAVAGMSLLRYLRLAFDLRDHAVYASSGDAHRLLLAVGLDIDDGLGGPTVSRVLPASRAEAAGLAPGDVIESVEDAATPTAREVRRALLAERGMLARIAVDRRGHRRRFVLDVPR